MCRYILQSDCGMFFNAFALSGRFFCFSLPKALPLSFELVGPSGRFSLQFYFSAHQLGQQAVTGFGEEADLG